MAAATPTDPFAPTGTNPNVTLGRDFSTKQADADGNSIHTGKPVRTSLDIYQEQQAAAIARHPDQATPDYDADPMWGLQDGQGDVIDKAKNTVKVPGFVKEDLPDPALQQPDFGWVPNPQDLIPTPAKTYHRTPQTHEEADQPDFAWDPQASELERPAPTVNLPGANSPDPVLQPNFGWTPNPEDAAPKVWHTARTASKKVAVAAAIAAAAAAAATKP